ncbi:DUF5676 family membrane protein [Methylophaga sp.]|jgi:hypothetical protein|uniref:DUF5676 family membrane protein n=1 Tax=Methylophaga sp. TaxID=2024840 RepID=UPI0013FEB92D|nr:DUF5676 family membrane protein [Methylophaga sp.]MTI64788.1 hypothetical protein [Methylophaga sp.]
MKFNSVKFALAATLTTAIIWVICSLLVFLLPQATIMASGDMFHMDIQDMMWSLTLSGFIKGLILWSLSVGLSAWIFAVIYNRLDS